MEKVEKHIKKLEENQLRMAKDNIDKANKQMGDTKDVDKVLTLAAKFTEDCIEYTESKFK
jgi:hypothetical protein